MMLKSSLIDPHPVLRDFIHDYTVCKSESAHVNLTFPLYANHETSLGFFLGDTSIQVKNYNNKNTPENTSKVFLFGLSTNFKETITSEGNCNTLTIKFKPNGFNRMFGIPASEICNTTYPANEVIGNGVKHFYEQLHHTSGVQEMASLADKFLIGFLNRQKATYINEGITRISHQLVTNLDTSNISQYAGQANMSIRNFERKFAEQVGTSPKLFCRLLRFKAALKLKTIHPKKSWTDIAYECGYYDSMHMIKEFKQFVNVSPTTLFNENPGFLNGGCYRIYPTLRHVH